MKAGGSLDIEQSLLIATLFKPTVIICAREIIKGRQEYQGNIQIEILRVTLQLMGNGPSAFLPWISISCVVQFLTS